MTDTILTADQFLQGKPSFVGMVCVKQSDVSTATGSLIYYHIAHISIHGKETEDGEMRLPPASEYNSRYLPFECMTVAAAINNSGAPLNIRLPTKVIELAPHDVLLKDKHGDYYVMPGALFKMEFSRLARDGDQKWMGASDIEQERWAQDKGETAHRNDIAAWSHVRVYMPPARPPIRPLISGLDHI